MRHVDDWPQCGRRGLWFWLAGKVGDLGEWISLLSLRMMGYRPSPVEPHFSDAEKRVFDGTIADAASEIDKPR